MSKKYHPEHAGRWRPGGRRLAGAALLTVGIAAAAACGTPTERVETVGGPAAAEAPDVVTRVGQEAGGAWAARVDVADEYAAIRADEAQRVRVAEAAGADRHLELRADEVAAKAAKAQLIADAAGADRHLELRADEVRRQLVADAAGSDRHLELRADEVAAKAQLVADAAGSDRHLELRADEVAAKVDTEAAERYNEKLFDRR